MVLRSRHASFFCVHAEGDGYQLAVEDDRNLVISAVLLVTASWYISTFCRHSGHGVAITSAADFFATLRMVWLSGPWFDIFPSFMIGSNLGGLGLFIGGSEPQ